MDRDKDGREVLADLELTRIALPRRVYTISHIEYAIDRKGLKFVFEPPVLRFFDGRLEAIDDWGKDLCEVYKRELGNY